MSLEVFGSAFLITIGVYAVLLGIIIPIRLYFGSKNTKKHCGECDKECTTTNSDTSK